MIFSAFKTRSDLIASFACKKGGHPPHFNRPRARNLRQILGGSGYMRGSRVERIYREVRVNAIGGGSEEIMRDLAARQMGL